MLRRKVSMKTSIWALPAVKNRNENLLCGNLDAGVVIVGAGIAGLTTAYVLAKRGLRPVVLDAAVPGAGETHHTTAHLASIIDDRFAHLEQWHGEAGARLAHESHAAAINFIERTILELGIECDFRRVDGYLFADGPGERPELRAELAAARRAGVVGAEFLDGTPLTGLESRACLRFPRQAQFDPGRYLSGLLKWLAEHDVPVFSRQRVLSWREKSDGKIHLETESGGEVTCDRAIFTCNDPFVRFRYYTVHAPYRSYAMAFRVADGNHDAGLFWDTHTPYHYLRFAPNPDGPGRLLIVGGEDHKTGQKKNEAFCWVNLEQWTRRHFPFVRDKVKQWSGQVLETMDGLALIGADPKGHGKVFLSSGDSGMGLTHGTLGALLLADLLEGKPNPWADLYRPNRFRWRAFFQYARENVNVFQQYTHHLVPAEKHVPTQDHGVVMQRGIRKVACLKHDGSRTELTAVCPHMGGLVTWNEAEGTWDCECHGSRFAPEGEVLNGPAVSPLKHVRDEEREKEPVAS